MTKTIDDYIDAARARAGLPSDRQLALTMKIDPATLNGWRMKRTWPADGQLFRLAELAGIDPKIALLQLNAWRTKSEAARSEYTTMAALIAKSLALGLSALILLGSAPGTKAAQTDVVSQSRYIMENFPRSR